VSTRSKTRTGLPIALSGALRSQLQQARIFTDLERDQGGRRIGVCACHHRAGATTLALNIAVMLGERSGVPVALVEANLRSPNLAARFDLQADPGFNAFAGGCAAPMAWRELPGLGVHAMLAEASDEPLPLLKKAASRVVSEIAPTFRHLVLDLPPALDYPDVGLMATSIEGIILVLEAEETRWQVAREVRKRLEALGVPLLGAVLNKKPYYVPGWLYRLL